MSRSRRALTLALAITGGLALLVVGIVLALEHLVPPRPARECTATGADGALAVLDVEQADNAAVIAGAALHRGLPARAVTIALATALQESKLRNIDYGDRDSLGLFQQRPSQGWGTAEEVMDPHHSTNAFYDVLVTIDYTGMPVTEAAQRVQRSAFPDAYARHEGRSRAFAAGLTGRSPAAVVCHLPPAAEDERAGAVGRARERLVTDLGELPTTVVEGRLSIDVAALDADPDEVPRLAWAVAHWAVATAGATGIDEVGVDGQVWRRSDGNDAGWSPAPGDEPPGTVWLR